MRYLIVLLCIAMSFTSCEGDPGPMGPPGPPGEDGVIAPAFEIEVDFNAGNNYSIQENYGFETVPSDVVLVYISWETIDGDEIWRLLPQTAMLEQGVLSYNYDFTDFDFRIFMEGTFDLNTLDSSWTQNQYFRVVVVPADYLNGIDPSNYNDVINATHVETFQKLQ